MSTDQRHSQSWLDSAPPASHASPQSYQNPNRSALAARIKVDQPRPSGTFGGTPAYPAKFQQQPSLYQAPPKRPPSVIPVILFSLFFGVLAAISAYNRGKKAETLGESPARYWIAFAVTNVAGGILACAVGIMLGMANLLTATS